MDVMENLNMALLILHAFYWYLWIQCLWFLFLILPVPPPQLFNPFFPSVLSWSIEVAGKRGILGMALDTLAGIRLFPNSLLSCMHLKLLLYWALHSDITFFFPLEKLCDTTRMHLPFFLSSSYWRSAATCAGIVFWIICNISWEQL